MFESEHAVLTACLVGIFIQVCLPYRVHHAKGIRNPFDMSFFVRFLKQGFAMEFLSLCFGSDTFKSTLASLQWWPSH